MTESLSSLPALPPYQSTDQASGLRRLFGKETVPLLAFASVRRGGYARHGRMSARIRLMMLFADELARAGQRVAILDEHPLPDGIAGAYGVESRRDLMHLLHGDCALDDVMLPASPGIAVVPAARTAGAELSDADEAALTGNLKVLKRVSACVMIDSVNRAHRALSPIARHAEEVIVVIAADGSDLMPAYALIKRMTLECNGMPASIIATHGANAAQARATFEKMNQVAFDHLGIHLRYRGAAFTAGVRRLSLMPARRACVPDPSLIDGSGSLSAARAQRDSVV